MCNKQERGSAVPTPITAIVLTKNEEEDLPVCLASLQWADEVLVFDSLSTDRTCDIAQQHGARVEQHPFTNFAAQHNAAQAAARHDWTLHIDADERVSEELRDEICALARAERLDDCTAYHIQRVHLFSGRWLPEPARRPLGPAQQRHIRHNEPIRLYDRRRGHWERPLHEVVVAPEPHGVLEGLIWHYSTTTLSRVYETLNHYSDLEAAYLHQTRRRASLLEATFRGVRSFVYHYGYSGLYRGGKQGFLLAVLYGFSKFLNYAKLDERLRIEANQGTWLERDRQLLSQFDTRLHERD
jgi:glycosyltransferase involved in cell wall biosynthesis